MAKVYGMEYYEACVPSFGSDGHPDLLAWDDAMDSNESDKEIWATFHDDEAADLCEPILERLFASREEDAKMRCDEATFINEDVRETQKERVSIEYFWEQVLYIDNGFDPDEFNWSDTDRDDNEYWWSCVHNDYKNVFPRPTNRRKHKQQMRDGLTKQVPKEQDFLSVVAQDLIRELEFSFNPYDMSCDTAEDIAREKFDNILRLGIQLYRDHSKYY